MPSGKLNLEHTARVHLDFDTGRQNLVFYGSSLEADYAFKKDTLYLGVSSESGREMRRDGWPRDLIERYVQEMLPFVGIKLDFFKNNTLKRTEYIEFENYCELDLEGLDRMRVKLFSSEDYIVETAPKVIRDIGEVDRDWNGALSESSETEEDDDQMSF